MMRQSQPFSIHHFSDFWGQIAGFHGRSKRLALVSAVAERAIPGVTTTAKSDCCASAQAKFLAVLVDDGEVAFHANRAVAEDSDFCACQGFLRLDFL